MCGSKKHGKELGTTLGIWMWSAPVYVEARDIHVLMLDFEAFG